jgi:uncharacterized membrane protein YgcG
MFSVLLERRPVMKKIIHFILLFILIVIVSITSTNFKAEDIDDDIIINKFFETVTVSKNRTYQVHLELEADFLSEHTYHGLEIDVRFADRVNGPDNQSKVVTAFISQLKTTPKNKYSETGDLFNRDKRGTIRLGDPNKYVYGVVNYTVDYTLTLSTDSFKDYDLINFDLIGGGWNMPILSYELQLITPDIIDKNKLEVVTGYYTDTVLSYTTSENRLVVKGKNLKSHHNVSVIYTLEDHYFSQVPNLTINSIIIAAVTILGVIISIILWYVFGKDTKTKPEVQYKPPLDLTPSDAEFILKGKITHKSYSSLLLSLAIKGYLRIENSPTSTNHANPYQFVKLKDYEEDNTMEKVLFHTFFHESDIYIVDQIDPQMDRSLSVIRKYVANRNESSIDKRSIIMKGKVYLVFIIVALIDILALALYIPLRVDNLVVAFVGFMTILFIYLNCHIFFGKSDFPKMVLIFDIIFPAFGLVLSIQYGLLEALLISITMIVGLFIILALASFMLKKSAIGDEVYSKFLGYKKYLKSMTNEQLSSLVSDDPEYADKIYPFLVVFDLNKKWDKKYNNILFKSKNEGYSVYRDFNDFGRHGRSFYNGNSNTSSGSSSGHSSGGSSGGSGGGGGHGW